jgi:hypothetical protein
LNGSWLSTTPVRDRDQKPFILEVFIMTSQTYGGVQSELFGELEDEFAGLHEDELEDELGSLHEDEFGLHESFNEGEEFFGKAFKGLARGLGGFLSKAAPILKSVARVAAPMVATAVGGPLGGILGNLASSALGEGEFEDELGGASHEDELEHGLGEDELGGSQHEWEEEHPEALPELGAQHEQHEFAGSHAESVHEMMAEMMAEVAAGAHTESEAEAMIGAASVTVLSARDRAALRRLLPHLVRGVAVLTRLLRRRRITRPAVRAVPTIMRRTAATLRHRAASGMPVNRRIAGKVMGAHTRRVLTNPRLCGSIIGRNVQKSSRARSATRTISG